MNGRKFIGASVLAIALMLGAAGTANATTVQEALDLIAAVETTLDGVGIGGRNAERTRASLESKLAGAAVKTSAAKFDKACLKLSDFIGKVGDLSVANAKGQVKMDPVDATQLADEAGDAQDVIIVLGGLDVDCSPL